MSFIAGLIVGMCFGVIIHELIENWVNKEGIVRCKDCKWFTERNGEHLCGAWEEIFYNPVEENGYCYKGVRKDGGENG